jgi:hypothetical protein
MAPELDEDELLEDDEELDELLDELLELLDELLLDELEELEELVEDELLLLGVVVPPHPSKNKPPRAISPRSCNF